MMMDFDRFTTAVKLAYRRCGGSAYSLEDVLHVFRYYFDTYEMIMETAHPMINVIQAASIIEKMPYLMVEDGYKSDMEDLRPEDYEELIDQHFATRYKRCDYNINHFFSGDVRYYRSLEVLL